jgi:gliding motility-associated-like protein
MLKWYPCILIFGLILFSGLRLAGQITITDNVCIGKTRHYHVDPNPGSTYTWWIDGVIQAGFTTNEFIHTWNTANAFLLELQERSSDGCPGEVRKVQVVVNPLPAPPTASLTQPSCTVPSGSAILSGLPLNGGWTIQPGAIIGTGSVTNISGLATGTYNFTVTDSMGCTSERSTEIFIKPQPTIKDNYTKVLSDYNGFNISCHGQSDGFIGIIPADVSSHMTFSWNGPGGFTASTDNITGLTSGKYTVLITDKFMCSGIDTISLTEPDSLELNLHVTEPQCPDLSDGEIRLTVTGGVPGNDYIYRWSDNFTGQNISNIPTGLYQVTVSDQNRCSAKDSVQVNSMNKTCLIIPEALSPNGDFINDVWIIGNIEFYPKAEITIYNRWGQSVWKSEHGYPHPWDGRGNGVNLPIDSYHYVIDLHNGTKPILGDITIVR